MNYALQVKTVLIGKTVQNEL